MLFMYECMVSLCMDVCFGNVLVFCVTFQNYTEDQIGIDDGR